LGVQVVDVTGDEAFDKAITAIRNGAGYKLCGLTLTVNDVALAITGDQFDIAWDVMEEVDGDESMIGLAE
jgi:hypothetical protein